MNLEIINEMESKLDFQAKILYESLANLKKNIKDIELNLKNYEKESTKTIKCLKKKIKLKEKKVYNNENRPQYGFTRKKNITSELLFFLKQSDIVQIVNDIKKEEEDKEVSYFEYLDENNQISLPSVTKIINKYIKKNKLQSETNRQYFTPDKRLKTLLLPLEECDIEKGYRYFNLQKYTKHLYLSNN